MVKQAIQRLIQENKEPRRPSTEYIQEVILANPER